MPPCVPTRRWNEADEDAALDAENEEALRPYARELWLRNHPESPRRGEGVAALAAFERRVSVTTLLCTRLRIYYRVSDALICSIWSGKRHCIIM